MIKEIAFVTLALLAITSAFPAEEFQPETAGIAAQYIQPQQADVEELETAETAYRSGGGHGGHHGGGHHGGGHGGHHGGHHRGGYGK